MDVVILMAGKGTRSLGLSSFLPKPLVPLHGQPLVRWVVKNLSFEKSQRYIFVCLKEHIEQFHLHKLFSSWNIDYEIVAVDTVTQGATCSALLAEPVFKSNELIIANSDQFIIYNKDHFLSQARMNFAGFLMTMAATGNKWSYVRLDEKQENVIEVKEKEQISEIGTVGVYYFRSGDLFSQSARDMINANDTYNNEFYLAPTFNYLIRKGLKAGHYSVGQAGKEMIGLGTSEDFLNFESSERSKILSKELFG